MNQGKRQDAGVIFTMTKNKILLSFSTDWFVSKKIDFDAEYFNTEIYLKIL